MRERNLLRLFLALNLALAGAFIAYLVLSNAGQPEVVATSFPNPGKANLAGNATVLATNKVSPPKTNAPMVATANETKSGAPSATNQTELKPVFSAKKITWEQVESDEYSKYIDSLRAVGCPEQKIRYIILADIDELFAKKRVKEAIAHDTQWWRAEPEMLMVNLLQAKGRELEEQRRALITRLLGSEALEEEKEQNGLWSTVQLTGPVLGNLSPELHNHVQEICAQALERSQTALLARDSQGQPPNPVDLARMREQTRADLKRVLNGEEMEEFLLRYSQNALQLRNELRGLEPTAEEFRKVFRALDPLDHQMQLQYGGKEALSDKQKERYERQREDLIREALDPQRFEAYLLAKDPLYLQAQMFARQYGAPKATMPIYQISKSNETKRQQIMDNPALTPQQKSEAINTLYQEQQRSIQKMAGEAKAAQ
jgi:hypothetical protein